MSYSLALRGVERHAARALPDIGCKSVAIGINNPQDRRAEPLLENVRRHPRAKERIYGAPEGRRIQVDMG